MLCAESFDLLLDYLQLKRLCLIVPLFVVICQDQITASVDSVGMRLPQNPIHCLQHRLPVVSRVSKSTSKIKNVGELSSRHKRIGMLFAKQLL